MTSKEAKYYLQKVLDYKRRIERLEYMIEDTESNLLPSAIRYDRDKVQTSPEDMFSKTVAQVSDMRHQLDDLICEYNRFRLDVSLEIDSLKNKLHADILHYHYIESMTLVDIARNLNYSESHIKREHGNALSNFANKHDTK